MQQLHWKNLVTFSFKLLPAPLFKLLFILVVIQPLVQQSASSLFNVPSFPLFGLDVICIASTDIHPLPYFLWYSTSSSLLPLPSGLLWPTYWPSVPYTSSSISLLKYVIFTLMFYMTKPSYPHFPWSMFKFLHPIPSSSWLVILPCHFTLDMYLNSMLRDIHIN